MLLFLIRKTLCIHRSKQNAEGMAICGALNRNDQLTDGGLAMGRKPSSEFQRGEDVARAILAASVDGIAPATDDETRLYYYGEKFFGNWSLACEAAGVSERSRVRKTGREWVILRLRKLYEAEGIAPVAGMDSKLRERAVRLFGSWYGALKAAEIPMGGVSEDLAMARRMGAPVKQPNEESELEQVPLKCRGCLWRIGRVCPTPSCIKGWEDGNYQPVAIGDDEARNGSIRIV